MPSNTKVFDQRDGQILGRPYIVLSTRSHNYAEFILNDPLGDIYAQINDYQKVEIEVGFSNNVKYLKFTGVIAWIGRKLPNGTIVKAMDLTATMKGNVNEVYNEGDAVKGTISLSADELTSIDLNNTDLKVGTYVSDFDLQSEFPLTAKLYNSNFFSPNIQTTTAIQPNTVNPYTQENLNSDNFSQTEKQLQINQTIDAISSINAISKSENLSFAEKLIISSGLKKIDLKSKTTISAKGQASFNSSQIENVTQDLARKGEVLSVSSDGKIKQNRAGDGNQTSLSIDYNEFRQAFRYQPQIIKRSAFNNRSGFGSISINGWSVEDKKMIGATVVSDNSPSPPATGSINVPDWGEIKLSDPIFDGCVYTWADATKNGTRVPTKEIMAKIVAIAPIIQQFTDQTVGKGNKWTITSWYRTPAANRAAGGSKNSQHLVGNAVDASFKGFKELHKSLYDSFEGGLAVSNTFIHLDNRGARARWTY